MARTKAKIFSQRDWEAAQGLDRMYLHLVEPERWPLMPQEEEKLDRLRLVWQILCEKGRTIERIRLIVESFMCTEMSARNYMRDAKALFFETLEFDHELELRVAYERFMLISEKAENEHEFDAAQRALNSAMKLREQIEFRQPKKDKEYAALLFTDDPLALAANVGEEVAFEHLGHESQNLLEPQAVGVPSGD